VFEPVGCHPDYRQRGLTRAVMLEGMARLKALGARKAFVNSLATSLPANRLYESSGFRLVDRQRKWVKSLA
jgi:ribosomal protein S18 acetylase RimI-like enzyme